MGAVAWTSSIQSMIRSPTELWRGRSLIKNRADMNATRFTGFMGSPLYMSPEQIREESINGPSDIFSRGIVMCQLLTGSHPFRANSLGAVYDKITSKDLPDGINYAVRAC